VAAITPPAPGLYSITTGWPSAASSPGWMARAVKSMPPPGGKPTMSLIGLTG
jgi:hypothetical protein